MKRIVQQASPADAEDDAADLRRSPMNSLPSRIRSLKARPLQSLWQRVPNCLSDVLPQGIPSKTAQVIAAFSLKEEKLNQDIAEFEWADEIASIDQSPSDFANADSRYSFSYSARERYLTAFDMLLQSLPSEEAARVASTILASEADTILEKMNGRNDRLSDCELITSIIIPRADLSESKVQIIYSPIQAVIAKAISDPEFLYHFSKHHREFEIFVADCYKIAGWTEVELTPQRSDGGRDVIATRHDVGTIRILEQTKAYAPRTQVTHDDVRAMIGVLSIDRSASKGIITTTSDFQPTVLGSPEFAPYMSSRLELRNGAMLREWLETLAPQSKMA
jgi:restriction system protein